MKLAVLFWFYKDEVICRNRLRMLRQYNPDVPIYGLYGGTSQQMESFKTALAPYLADFYYFSMDRSPAWKWENGDLMITEWYCQRGHTLSWDTVVIVHWDMLIFGSLSVLFAGLGREQVLISGLRAVEEVSTWWSWITAHRERYESFFAHIRREYAYAASPFCCQFILACLPRRFLDLYSKVKEPELGFIEYRLPAYAQAFGFSFYHLKELDCWWPEEPATKHLYKHHVAMSAAGVRLPYKIIWRELRRYNGRRFFHPFTKAIPIDAESSIRFMMDLVNHSNFQSGRTMKFIKRRCRQSNANSTE